MKSMTHPWWLLAGLAILPAAQAGSQAIDESAEPPVSLTAADSRIAIDPATGKPRPLTAEERQHLSQQRATAARLRRSEPLGAGKRGFVAPATETEARASLRTLPGGAVMQPVPESMMSELSVHRDAEGRLHLRHGDSGQPLPTEEPPHE